MNRIIALLAITVAASLFAFPARAQLLDEPQVSDNFYEKVNTKDREPRPYVHVREADVFIKWRVWRVIDLRMKMNQYLYYPTDTIQDRISLMNLIMEGLQNGVIVPYDPINDYFSKATTYEEFIQQNTHTDTIMVENLDDPEGGLIQKVTTTSFQTHNVKMFRLKEDWFIDKQRGVRDIRILGMAPVIQVFDENGEFKGNQTLFWLYYPSLRSTFAKREVFNSHNSAMRQSYDDVFAWNRYFQSYIYKIDNLQDRQISAYTGGINALRESDRIEEMLFEIEHDLWVY